jgi:hypothetical protein
MQQRASQNGLLIHLGSLHFKAKKIDIEKHLKERGFDECTFFWPDVPPNYPGEHKGWCRVQFAEKEVAERAKSALHDTLLIGRPIKIGSIENTAVSTDRGTRWSCINGVANVTKAAPQALAQRAQAHPTIAPIAQPPRDLSISSESVAGILVQETITLVTQASLGPSPSLSARAITPSSCLALQATNDPPSLAAEALRSLRLTEYPKSWRYNPENPGLAQESVMSRIKQLERAYENASVVARPLVKISDVVRDKAEIQAVHSQQYPSPAPQNSSFANKQFICVDKGEGKQRETKTIELARLPEFTANGWQEWQYAGRPPILGTDKDPRQILKINDVWENDAPYNDAAHQFAAEIRTSHLADRLSWQPGQLLGGGDVQAQAPISHSPTFISPAESSKNFQSATSRGHQLKFPRPAGVGASWGDHDLFREWQIHGRQVKRSMVENKEWLKVRESTIEFVPAHDSLPGTCGVTIPPDQAATGIEADNLRNEEAPKSLFEALNPKRQASQRGGRQGGHSGRDWGAARAVYDQRRQQTGEDQNW